VDTPVVKPGLLDFGHVAPGQTARSTVQIHPPSDAAVTAAIVQDAAGIFTVRQIVAYDVVPEAVDPHDPSAPANTPVVGVPHRRCASDGRAPLAVRAGQLVAVEVEAAPVAGGEDILDGVLEIQGTGWTPTRRSLRVAVAGGG
jgi:hypothetical protein